MNEAATSPPAPGTLALQGSVPQPTGGNPAVTPPTNNACSTRVIIFHLFLPTEDAATGGARRQEETRMPLPVQLFGDELLHYQEL